MPADDPCSPPRLVSLTGATGFLGRRLLRTLLDEPVRIRCLVRARSDVSGLIDSLPAERLRDVEFVRGELSDPSFVDRQLAGVDVLYHLAAALEGDLPMMERDTLDPTRRLVSAAVRNRVGRFVLVSSLGVYGTGGLDRLSVLDESTPIEPEPERRDPYTASKIQQEQAAWQAREESGLPLVVVRPGVIYGPGRSPLTNRVGLSVRGVLIGVGGGQPLPYTYVENCADAVSRAGLVPGAEGEAFNVIDDDLPTGRRIVRLLRGQGQAVRTVWVPWSVIGPLASLYECCSGRGDSQGVISRYKANAIWKPLRYCNTKAKQGLDWRPIISTEQGLRRTVSGAGWCTLGRRVTPAAACGGVSGIPVSPGFGSAPQTGRGSATCAESPVTEVHTGPPHPRSD